MSSPLQIDDRDPSIVYISAPNGASSWNQEGGNVLEFNNSVTWTDTALASVAIPFTGTGISVWGTILNAPNPTPQTGYSIDDGPVQFVNETVQAHTSYQQKFFESSVLAPGSHNLLILNLVNGSNFRLDFVQVNVPDTVTSQPLAPLPSSLSSPKEQTSSQGIVSAPTLLGLTSRSSFSTGSSPTAALSTSSSNGIQTVFVSGGSAPTQATSTPAPISANKNQVRIAPVVGGLLGGVIVVLILLFMIFLRKRRNSERRRQRLSYWAPSENVIREDIRDFEIPTPYLPPYDAGSDKLKTLPPEKLSTYLHNSGLREHPASPVTVAETKLRITNPTRHSFDARSFEHSPPQYDA